MPVARHNVSRVGLRGLGIRVSIRTLSLLLLPVLHLRSLRGFVAADLDLDDRARVLDDVLCRLERHLIRELVVNAHEIVVWL